MKELCLCHMEETDTYLYNFWLASLLRLQVCEERKHVSIQSMLHEIQQGMGRQKYDLVCMKN